MANGEGVPTHLPPESAPDRLRQINMDSIYLLRERMINSLKRNHTLKLLVPYS